MHFTKGYALVPLACWIIGLMKDRCDASACYASALGTGDNVSGEIPHGLAGLADIRSILKDVFTSHRQRSPAEG